MSEIVESALLTNLLREVSWVRITGDKSRMPVTYGGFRSEVLLRIHLLPYLIPVWSERQLAFYVAESVDLQKAVGLELEDAPRRGTLWHFRKRNLTAYQRMLGRALAILSLEAEAIGVNLPFVEGETRWREDSAIDCFSDCKTKARISIGRDLPARISEEGPQLSLPIMGLLRPGVDVRTRLFLPQEIGFPLRLRVCSGRQRPTVRKLSPPAWFEARSLTVDAAPYFQTKLRDPYTACNVVVVREIDGMRMVLLAKRLRGSGRGAYTVPGGKKRERETVRACAVRELREETGMELRAAHPISVNETSRPGFPPVTSVGVLAHDVLGEPRQLEHHQHSPWRWYPLDDLPRPLFFPTKQVLDDFNQHRFPGLTWEDVEDAVPELPLWREVL